MAAMPSTGQLIYHMTSIDNLSSILKFWSAFPKSFVAEQQHTIYRYC